MPWRFVGRTEQIERARSALQCRRGPLVITGEPGMGRTSVLRRVLGHADPGRDEILLIRPAGDAPLAALRASFLGPLPAGATPPEAAAAIAGHAAGRRLIIAADDAHLMDHSSLLSLRELSRAGDALLLVTRAAPVDPAGRPDPTECLSYEPGIEKLLLPPLSVDEVAAVLAGAVGVPVDQAAVEAVQAATGGNPRLLHELVAENRLAECIARQAEGWNISVPPWPRPKEPRTPETPRTQENPRTPRAYSGAARVVEAAWDAWRELDVDRADQLCRLAVWCGIRDETAPIWASLLLLQGHADACLEFLDSLRGESSAVAPQLAMIRALALALGFGRAEDAADALLSTAGHDAAGQVTLAYRAWLLAVTGRRAAAAMALRGIQRTDPETALFVHATRAALTSLTDVRAESVFHLRRALAVAEGGGNWCPWMRSYLKASLIDALLVSGRAKEALSTARRFHAHEPGSGWKLTVALEDMISRVRQPVAGPAAA
jgi:hypothetical protein